MQVRLTKEQKESRVTDPLYIFKIMHQILMREDKMHRDKEHFWTVSLKNGYIVLIELVALGPNGGVNVSMSDIFSFSMQKRAGKIILVHNHPGGTLKPTLEDIKFTDQVMTAGKMLELPVVDHLIISEDDKNFYSFAQSGIMEQFQPLINPEAPDLMQEARELIKHGENQGERNKALQMAKNCIEKGLPAETIIEITGLSQEDIKDLVKD